MLSRRDYRTSDFLFYGAEMRILNYQVRPASQPAKFVGGGTVLVRYSAS